MEACCCTNDECLDLPLNDCLEQGGLPMGPGTKCGPTTHGGIGSCTWQACCVGEDCFNGTYGDCRGANGRPLGRGIRCEQIAEVGCQPGGVTADCCLLDGSRLYDVFAAHCAAARGVPPLPTGECPPPPVDEDCRFPEADRVVGPRWTLELCARAPFGVQITRRRLPGRKPGYGVLLSVRGTRHDVDAESCGLAAASLWVNARRYGTVGFCSRQTRNRRRWRAHEGDLAVERRSAGSTVKPGYGVYAAPYEAPDWSEVIVGSILQRCTGAVV